MNSSLEDFSLVLQAFKTDSANARLVLWSGKNGSGFVFFDSGFVITFSNEFFSLGIDKEKISFMTRFNGECTFGFSTDLEIPSSVPPLTAGNGDIDQMLSITYPNGDTLALFTVKDKIT